MQGLVQHVIIDRHWTHPQLDTFQSAAPSLLFTLWISWAAQEKLHETPCLLQRSERLRPDLTWTHLSTSWPDLTWLSHSLVSGPGGLLFFSLRFLSQLRAHYCSGNQTDGPRCVRECAPLCKGRGVLLHIRNEAAEGYLCFLIFFIVFDVLSWSSRSSNRIISQMDSSDLLKICPITANPTAEEKTVVAPALFSQICNVTHIKGGKKGFGI